MSRPRAKVTFEVDEAALAEVLAGVKAMSHLEAVAWSVVGALREASPKQSGRLSRSWSARLSRDERGRPVARVTTSASYWHVVSYGSVNTNPNRFIDRAMARTGLPYEPLGKEA